MGKVDRTFYWCWSLESGDVYTAAEPGAWLGGALFGDVFGFRYRRL